MQETAFQESVKMMDEHIAWRWMTAGLLVAWVMVEFLIGWFL